jgi:hypothetical protein
MGLTAVEREIVATVVHRFLSTKESTSQLFLIKRFKDPDVIDKLTPVILKTGDGEKLWPGVLAFECCDDPDALRFARKSLEVVIHVLQDLFNDEEVEKMDFTIAEVEDRARTMFGAIQPETIRFGLHFVQEFSGIHAGLGGVFPDFTFVRVHRRVGLLKNIPGAWDDFVARFGLYLEQNHGVDAEPKETGA